MKVTRSVDTGDGEMSPQEEETIKAIVDARSSLTDKCKSFKLAQTNIHRKYILVSYYNFHLIKMTNLGSY